jgi:molybdate transport system ATP-binding protein
MGLSVSVRKDLGSFLLDVSWNVGNELAVLCGYSGAGKSMTFRMIAGLLRPDRGLIALDGRTLYDSSSGTFIPPQERALGYVFQDLALFPHMTVKRNILYGGQGVAAQERESMADLLMRRFRISALEARMPAQISGGQKQRVALARALMRRPSALLLDEPFSALDSPTRLAMGALLKEIQREFNIPVVLITHDITEAHALADKMIVCSEGRIVRAGPIEDVMRHPEGPEIETLLRWPAHNLARSRLAISPHP